MLLTHYEPWNLLDRFYHQLDPPSRRADDDILNGFDQDWAPAVDIKAEDDRFVILAEVPGVNPDDIEVTMDKGVLTLKGERKQEESEEGKGYHRSERIYGKFLRRFSLPDDVDPDHVSANANNGVLKITIPKQEKPEPRRIAINA